MGGYLSVAQAANSVASTPVGVEGTGTTEAATVRRYGWIRDHPKHTENLCNLGELLGITAKNLPSKIDLRVKYDLPPVYDQLALGSCTAQALAFGYQFDEIKQGQTDAFTPSRLFIYFNERKADGTINYDAGSSIGTGIDTLKNIGTCSEEMWPYDITKFKDEPPAACYEFAKKYHAVETRKVSQNLDELKIALSQELPIEFGFVVYESFESADVAKSGMIVKPVQGEKVLGGHAVAIVAYDDNMVNADGTLGAFLVRNSWSEKWGQSGYFWMPYSYALNANLASDFWVIGSISVPDAPVQKREPISVQTAFAPGFSVPINSLYVSGDGAIQMLDMSVDDMIASVDDTSVGASIDLTESTINDSIVKVNKVRRRQKKRRGKKVKTE